jgi:putative tricarboxylic transport membrane protein
MLRKADLWLSLVLLVLSALVFHTASGFDEMPSRFPKLLAVVFAALAIMLAISVSFRKEKESPEFLAALRGFDKPLVLVVGMVVYIRVVDILGYLIPSVLLFFCVGWMLGYRKHVRLAVTGLVAVLIVYAVFNLALGVPLPSPPWWPA